MTVLILPMMKQKGSGRNTKRLPAFLSVMNRPAEGGDEEEVFILRKDDEGHWKLFGWQPVDNEDTTGTPQ